MTSIIKVPMVKPDIGEKERQYVNKVMQEGEIGVKSPYVREFEEKFADYVGYKYGVFCNSGWSAVLLAVRASGWSQFVTPTFTMIATATAIKQAGATPFLYDCNQRGLMNARSDLPIVSVDIYGQLAQVKSPFIIEDAAEVMGKIPYYGNIVCFSFFYNKIMTVGQGGMCVTNDEALYKEMKLLRHHYYDGSSYFHEKDGYNLSQSGIHAAIGLAQLERIDEILERRKAIGEYFNEKIKGWSCPHGYWYYPYVCDNHEEKEDLKKFLADNGIESRDFFNPIHNQPPFKMNQGFPVADDLYARGLLLPMYSTMTDIEKNYVVETIEKFKNNKIIFNPLEYDT